MAAETYGAQRGLNVPSSSIKPARKPTMVVMKSVQPAIISKPMTNASQAMKSLKSLAVSCLANHTPPNTLLLSHLLRVFTSPVTPRRRCIRKPALLVCNRHFATLANSTKHFCLLAFLSRHLSHVFYSLKYEKQ
jgi:hypothetical protein